MAETWRPVVGWETTHAVSDQGRVRGPRGLLRPTLSRGYPKVELTRPGERLSRRVHVLVAAAFVGPRPEGQEVRHLDGDPLNPRAANLVYGTHARNALDSVEHGTHGMARKQRCSRGHLLRGRNLRAWELARGRRSCRACHRALNHVRRWGGDTASIADAFYREDTMTASLRATGLTEEQTTVLLDRLAEAGVKGASSRRNEDDDQPDFDVYVGLEDADDISAISRWLDSQGIDNAITQDAPQPPASA